MKKKKKKAKCFIVNHQRIYHEYIGDGNHISLFCLGVWCWMVVLVCFDDDLCLLGFKCLSILSHIIFHDTKPSSHVLSMNKRTHSETEKKCQTPSMFVKHFALSPSKRRDTLAQIDSSLIQAKHTHIREQSISFCCISKREKHKSFWLLLASSFESKQKRPKKEFAFSKTSQLAPSRGTIRKPDFKSLNNSCYDCSSTRMKNFNLS